MEEKSRVFSLHGLPLRFVQLVLVAAFLLMNSLPAMAQTGVRVKGVVKSASDGEALIGVNIVQKGTTNGTVTDFDGNFELTVPVGADLDVSYIGYLAQQVKIVAGKTTYEVALREDVLSLDEVVVVGYGVQKKKLVTGATVQVSGENIQKLSTTSAFTALQSQTPGVNITQNSNRPGDGFKVTVRGLGTVGDSKPLYVIDGITGGDLNNLNPADIESIDVLKDAASAAIYGARAANGVVLVTTKQGKAGKMTLTYDGYAGVQNAYRMPSLLNAKEYMSVMDEIQYNEGNDPYDWASLLPADLYSSIQNGTWNGTNWADEFRNNDALTQNHAVNLTGGSDVSKFSLGFSFTEQEGIFGKPLNPLYDRYTVRVNSEHILLKAKGFDAIKIGENILYTYTDKNTDLGAQNIYWNDMHNMLVANPLLPVYDKDGNFYDQNDKAADGWLFDGGAANPIGLMANSSRGQAKNRSYNLRANAYIEVQPIKDLKFRSVFGYNMSSWTGRSYTSKYNFSTTATSTTDQINQNAGSNYSVSWENTLAYSYKIDSHSFDAVIGQSIEKWGMGESMSASGKKSLFPNRFGYAYLDNSRPTELGDVGIHGSPAGEGSLASFFGRVNYNYKETYMASVILRADGSSNFARGNRWGYFPSVSAGWVITNEAFMESTQAWLDFFKLRGSWGQNGNSNIPNFQYLSGVTFEGASYYFGDNKTSQTVGGYAKNLPNPDVTWESTVQLDLGVDARFLNSRLGLAFDWYNKKTKDWLVQAPILASYGTGAPYINGGDIVNKGVEVALNWNDHIGDFTYGINANVAYNKNEVTRIANDEGIIHGKTDVLSQGTGEIYRAQVGYPLGYFWGYKTEGIYQNQAQIDQRRAEGKGTLSTAQPGDVIFADLNKDGVIDELDKTMIGDPHPDVTAGLTLTFGYKGFDLSATAYGAFGQQIAKSYRSFADSKLQNYTTEVFERWTGEGTSNKWPRLTSGSNTNYQYLSDIWIENGDYVRLQNLTLGYDFKKLFPKMPLGQARLYVTAQNLFTITGYSGMDPEVGYGGDTGNKDASTNHGNWASGIDVGYYPSPRTYLVGVNLKF